MSKKVYVDRVCRGNKSGDLQAFISGAKRVGTETIGKKLKRRNVVEPVIGHIKSNVRLARNFFKDAEGDAMNAILCGAALNLRKTLTSVAPYWLQILANVTIEFRIPMSQAAFFRFQNRFLQRRLRWRRGADQ